MSVGLEWAEWGFCKCYKQAGIVLNKKGIETTLFNGAHAEATEPLMLPNGFGSEHIGSALPMTEVDGGVEGDALERTVLIFANGVGCKAVGLGIVGTGVLNVIGSIVGAAIARKKAKKLVENVLAECDTDNTCTDGCSGKCDTWMPRRAESEE